MIKVSRLVFLVLVFMSHGLMATVIPGKYSSIPQYLTFNKNEAVTIGELSGWMARHFSLPAGNGLRLLSKEVDQLGITHYRYRQTVNDIPVEGTMYIAHVRHGFVESVSGDMLDAIQAPSTPAIDPETAIVNALVYTGAQQYKWQSTEAENGLKDLTGNANASYYPSPKLVYIGKGGKLKSKEFVLAYKMDVYAVKPLSRKYVFVNAITGVIEHTINRIENVDVVATAQTQYSGTQAITTDSYNNAYRLREAARGNGIRTYNAQQSTNPGNVDFTNATTTWNNVNANKDQYATDAHFASEMTYDFYRTNFNRNSLDDNGLVLAAYVHYDQNLDNAFWDGAAMYYGDGDAANGTTPYTTLDIGGHEITHGLTEYTANLNYQDESGALNESFSDCMGIAIRQFVKQSANVDYLIGNDNGNAFRSMRTPKTYQQPDTYLGQYWYTGAQDNGGVHINSGVQNHWFYILAKGENSTNDNNDAYNVTGIGIEKAQAITYRNLAFYLTPSSEYADARTFAIVAAQDLYGACSPEVIATTNAWYAVGVGDAFVPGVVSNFSAPVTSACGTPAEISFSDASTNANTYAWDFGDGNTSTLANPTHTYNTFGTFTVKLISSSSACGADSITKTQYITVNDNRPSVNGNQTICSGNSATLNADGNGDIAWYDAAQGGNQVFSGATFTTPALTQSSTYFVSSLQSSPLANVGPPSQNFGNGSYNNFPHYMEFNNTKPQKLLTVLIDASSAGNRLIELRDASNNVLSSATVNLTAGTQTISLNFDLPAANGLRLGIWTGTTALYRNSSSASYPYNSTDGTLSIVGNDAGDLGRYYFFYNWQLQQPPCASNRVPVNVTVLGPGCVNGIGEQSAIGSLSLLPNPANAVLNVRLNATQANANGKLLIQNILGETLLTLPMVIISGSNNQSVDLANYAPGVYLLTVQSDKTAITRRFVKQ